MHNDYCWTENKTCAHDYLLPYIIKIFNRLKVNGDFLILDAGCGGGYILERFFKEGYKKL